MLSSGVRIALFTVEVFVALTAIGGGIALVSGLEGNRFPPEMLEGTPFGSYVIPGLILAVVVGGSAAAAAVAMVFNLHAGALASIVAGVVMMGWILGYRTRTGEHLSLTTFITACFAHAVNEYRLLHAYRKGRGKLMIFEDVNVTVMVERELDGEKIPLPFIIRGANHKSCLEIDREIKAARTTAEPQSRAIRWSGPWLLVPAFIRRLLVARLLSNPQRRKRITGTTILTNPGMFGNGRAWGMSPPMYTASLVAGSIDTKPGMVDGKIEVREYLYLTLTVDHDIGDGAMTVRFTQRLKDLIESVWLLDQSFGREAADRTTVDGERPELGRLRR